MERGGVVRLLKLISRLGPTVLTVNINGFVALWANVVLSRHGSLWQFGRPRLDPQQFGHVTVVIETIYDGQAGAKRLLIAVSSTVTI